MELISGMALLSSSFRRARAGGLLSKKNTAVDSARDIGPEPAKNISVATSAMRPTDFSGSGRELSWITWKIDRRSSFSFCGPPSILAWNLMASSRTRCPPADQSALDNGKSESARTYLISKTLANGGSSSFTMGKGTRVT